MMKKILVIHSGGLDSTVLLYKAICTVGKSNVYTLSFNYGQKHQIELNMRQWHQNHLGLKDSHCLVLDIANIFGWDKQSALLGHSEVSHESYSEQLKHAEVVSAYVPYRNGTLLSIAASIAYSLGCDTVAYGAHADDAVRREQGAGQAAYPDCTREFIEAQSRAILEGTGGKVSLWAPLGDLTKAEVVGFGLDACMTREEFEHTHSCYEGVEGGCGTCGTCIKEGSKVLLADWTQKPIEQLRVGDKILSATEEGQLTTAEVTEVIDKGVQGVVQLGPLTLTPDHRVYTTSRNHTPAGFISVGDWKDGNKYKVFDTSIIDKHEHALGYLRGLVDGDGSYSRGVFLCQTDKTLLQEYVYLYNKHVSPTTMKPHYDEARNIYIVGGGTRTTFDRITSWEEHKYNKDYLLGYLNGIVISDGCFSKQNGSMKITISQSLEVNKDICDNILYALDKCHICYNTWSSRCGGSREEGALMMGVSFHRCYQLPLLYGTTKKEKGLQMYFDNYNIRTASFYSVTAEVIEAAEPSARVFDINTTTGTFFCEGVWVHNCIDRNAALDTYSRTAGCGQSGVPRKIITDK